MEVTKLVKNQQQIVSILGTGHLHDYSHLAENCGSGHCLQFVHTYQTTKVCQFYYVMCQKFTFPSHSVFCLQEIVRVISEERADIHVDIILHRACVNDLGHYCSDVPRGEGRRKSSLSHFHVAIVTLLGHLVISASLVSPVQTSSAVK